MTEKRISNLEDHLGYRLRCLSNYIHDSFKSRLAKHDISVAQWVVLRVIYDNNGIMLNHAAEIIGVDKSSLSRMVERLAKRGLLARSKGLDRRSISIELTAAGMELVPKLAALADENEKVFFKTLGTEEREKLLKVIKKLLDDNGFEKSKRGLAME
jgi:DNA-binding MarR family transcriptional regulator